MTTPLNTLYIAQCVELFQEIGHYIQNMIMRMLVLNYIQYS